jgi:hypothetical protein
VRLTDNGVFELPQLAQLNIEDQVFVTAFVRSCIASTPRRAREYTSPARLWSKPNRACCGTPLCGWARSAPPKSGLVPRTSAGFRRAHASVPAGRAQSTAVAVRAFGFGLSNCRDCWTPGAAAASFREHPEAGTLEFDATLLPLPGHPGHNLILHNPRPGTEARREKPMRKRSLVVADPGWADTAQPGAAAAEWLP